MKKRILSVLLVVAMLATMIVMPVYADGNATQSVTTTAGDKCPCCNKAWDAITWTLIDGENLTDQYVISAGGHYRMTSDFIKNYNNLISITAAGTEDNNVNVVLDFDGHEIRDTKASTANRAVNISGTYSNTYLLDTNADKDSTTVGSAGSNQTKGYGATIYLNAENSTLSIYDITINSTKNTSFASSTGRGAALAQGKNTTVNMHSGVIQALSGVQNKYALVELTGNGATFNMYGGTINANNGKNALATKSDCSDQIINIEGGTINGTACATKAADTVKLSGAPVITNLDLSKGTTVTLDATKPLTDGVSIGVTAAADTAFTASAADEAAAKALATKFYSNVDGKSVRFNDAFALVLTEGNPYRDCPHCGQIVEFAPYTYESGKSMTKVGHYYLVDVVVTTSEVGIGSTDGDIVLDLSGKSITKKFRAFSIRKNTKVFMFDSVGGSVVTGGHTAENRIGSCIYMNPADEGSSTELTLYSGTYRWYKEGAENLANGGVIYCSGGCELTVTGDAVITGGKTAGNGGNICAVGNSEVTISGNAKVYGGQAAIGADIYSAGILNIAETVTGEMKLGFPSSATAYGEAIANTVYGAGELNKDLKLTLDITRDRATPIEVISTVTEVEGEEPVTKYQLSAVVGTIAVTDGVQTWYDNAADAVAADADYIKACGQDIKLASDAIVDINGSNVALTADAAVTAYCFDNTNNDYFGYGSVTADANVTVKSLDESDAVIAEATAANYIVLENEGAYSVHALDLDVSAIGLKTASNGMYYYANYKCDDTLKAEILSYGIEYALYDAEGTAPVAGTTTQIIEIENDGEGALVTNEDIAIGGMNGVIGSDIAGYTDAECGKMKIMATPVIAVGNQVISGATVGYSMFDCCQAVYDMIAACNAAGDTETAARYTELMNNLFTQTWAEYELDSWVFENVPETVA